jgi:cytochrome c553
MKQKSYLIIAFILTSVLVLSLCTQKESEEHKFEVPTPLKEKPTPTPTPVEQVVKKEEPIDGDCLNCHYNKDRTYVPQADVIAGHLDASDDCIYCHVEDASEKSNEQIVTDIHTLHGEIYNDCFTCHQTDISIKPHCGQCHAEDPLKSSNGDVFVIHTPRNVGCTGCHGDDFLRIHQHSKAFPEDFSFPE